MLLGRIFDAKCIALQRTGKLGTYPSILGQEAIGVAIGQQMQAEDILVPYYRDLLAQTLRGVRLVESLLFWGGDERGNAYRDCPHDFPNCVPIATQLCHAAGAAIAVKVRGEHRAVVATCGEGATSKGDFLETLNLAGAWHIPLVIVVNNNQWAISTPRSQQSAAETIAQKAIAAGIRGIQVDGNDYFALSSVLKQALETARHGKGATLIEAVSYRLSDHTTADDARRYRRQEEIDQAWQAEPIKRLRSWLEAQGDWNAELESVWQQSCRDQIEQAVLEYLATPPQPPESMFDFLYEALPETLSDQYLELRYASAGGER
jgi:pyruvate dehydrogenase E1 component alpha subunit